MSGENPEQAAVVAHRDGPMVVLAGAGSGKTRAIIHRTAELTRSGVSPDEILLVTFSNKAAAEMRARLQRLGCAVEARTWHSLCGRILREDRTEWAEWTVDSKNKAKSILKEAVGYKGLDWKGADVGKLSSFIGTCKANLFEPDSAGAADLARAFCSGRDAALAVKAFHLFQEKIEEQMFLTFDDMLVFTHRHLSEGGACDQWGARWKYLVQDEAQDANEAQVQIARLLAQGHRNYTIVGDPAQAIYGFRGSKPDYLMGFAEEWGAKVVNMHRNYRCGSRIIAVANATLERAAAKLEVPLTAERETAGTVTVVRAGDLDDEAARFVAYAKAAHATSGSWSGTTCLFRLNAQSRALEDALIRAKVPYVLVGGTGFYERREVKDLLAYLRVAVGHGDVVDALRRSINAPFRFLGAKFVEKVQEAWEEKPGDVVEAVTKASNRAGIQRRQHESAAEWSRLVMVARESLTREVEPQGPRAVLDDLVRTTGYIQWLEKEEGAESIESSHGANVRELIRLAEQFATAKELLDYIDETIRAASKRRESDESDCVLLMSIYRSKGLEWPRVWVVGCNEKILPHAKGDPEEERRIFYVAATRAKDELTLSYVGKMALRAGVQEIGPSQFVCELEEKVAGSIRWVDAPGDVGEANESEVA